MARAELEAARAWGVPRSVFLGRDLPGPGEPLWLDDDRAWALALLALEADTCPNCGQPRSESTLKENEFSYRAEPVRCHGDAAIDRAQTRVTAGRNGSTAGLSYRVSRIQELPR